MKTVEAPDRTMAKKMPSRLASGKLRARLAEDQSSTRRVRTIRTGMDRRLL
jgi:hypothetical protein